MPKWVVETKTSPILVGLNVTGDILARALSREPVETQYLAVIWVILGYKGCCCSSRSLL